MKAGKSPWGSGFYANPRRRSNARAGVRASRGNMPRDARGLRCAHRATASHVRAMRNPAGDYCVPVLCVAARGSGRRVTDARVSATSPRPRTFCSRRSMISHCMYICRNRRSASVERRGEDQDVVDPLARFGANVESVSNHRELLRAPLCCNPAHPLERQGFSAEGCYDRSTLARKHPVSKPIFS